MSPAQQAVQVPKLFVKLIVFLRTDSHRFNQRALSLTDRVGQGANPSVRADAFAVLYAAFHEFARDPAIDIHTRDHERPEEISLATFIYAEMRRKHFR